MEPRSERRAAQKGRAEIGHFIEPMACLAVADLPAGSDWEYELKLDGYRAIAFKTRGRVHLRSRNGKDFSQRFWSLIRPLQPLADETVVDGEIVALDDAGRPSFHLLQNSAAHESGLCVLPLRPVDPCGRRPQRPTARSSPQALAEDGHVTIGGTHPLLGNDRSFRGGSRASATRAGSGGGDRETAGQFVPGRKAIRCVDKNAGQPGTRAGYRRLCACVEELRLDRVRLL